MPLDLYLSQINKKAAKRAIESSQATLQLFQVTTKSSNEALKSSKAAITAAQTALKSSESAMSLALAASDLLHNILSLVEPLKTSQFLEPDQVDLATFF
ncbi:hypothetical protein Psal006b_01875 [Piscirickettsia salmonis]|uniref:Uncharacterized protein n=1 Tax=Piscirickettsia salmonis TaxID=1238 RepID=A0AAC8VHD8_PISSA|nr:hypothetical protein [Piscirickettsia salmonis]ALB22520.1 hypothetical protein KU39_1338 [Piscirickettsia salmonis]ALT18338.1 hypothetical protein PSLF89_05420 [Piscirickettsia salmonis LF-89 = ATCC VR-1361]ALY02550.1 hypothetical protein AWE47_06550 [Piscirickettsia salmonis]AMA42090.1 hypothetical protein AWJ11_06700 [Piscirickettsia salmonis]AOS34566.1 hypothetical protein AVM72_03870 [Piscirickettsia salmonis]